MRRPATHFAKVLNRLTSTYLPKPLNDIQDSAITFIARYVAWVTHNSLYCISFNGFGRYVDVNLFKTFAKCVAGRRVRRSLEFVQGLAISSVTDKSTIDT